MDPFALLHLEGLVRAIFASRTPALMVHNILGYEHRFVELQRPRDGPFVKIIVHAEERDKVAGVQKDHGFLGRPQR